MSPSEMVVPVVSSDPLRAVHEQAEAEFQSYAAVEIVATFGEPQAEYAAIRKGAGVADLPQRAVIELTGRDRLSFLNNLLTNATYDKAAKAGMAAGRGCYAFLLNAKTGRIVADVNVIERGDRTLLEVDGRLAAVVCSTLDRYLFGEQVKIVPPTGAWHEMAVHGPKAAEVAGATLAAGENAAVELFGVPAVVWRDDPAGVPGYHLLVPTEGARTVWMNLVAAGVRPVGWAAFNAARVEAGRPLFGIDFDEQALPAETGPVTLGRAVSFTKGCYPGQEVVARMHARQQVAKQVVGLRVADDALPIAGAPVTDDAGNTVGGVTSSTASPVLSGAAVAIATVKRAVVAVGTVVNVAAEGAVRRAVVAELPFIKAAGEGG